MPQPIAYNTGSQTSGSLKLFGIEYAISSSIVSGSNNQRWFSSVNPGNGVVFVTSNYTQSYGTYQASVPLFFTASDYTDAAITGAINGLPDRFGQVPFTDTTSAYAWVQNSGKYFMMNYEYPQIVTDKLSFLVDASFLASYPTTASTWYDLSGNAFNGTLINGPTWNSNGWITFDGVDDLATTLGGGITNYSQPFSMGVWFYIDPAATWDNGFRSNIYSIAGSFAGQYGLFKFSGNLFGMQLRDADSTIYATVAGNSKGIWYYLISTWDGSILKLYRNGELVSTQTAGGITGPPDTSNLYIGGARSFGGAGGNVYQGNIAKCEYYKRELSATEILQNYYQAPIVTDGLVFAVDAGNLVSYENGSGITYSLTGSLSGSLVNGVGYSNGNGGNWDLDGSDDYINIPYSGSTSGSFTFTIAMKCDTMDLNTSNRQTLFGLSQNGNAAFRLFDLEIFGNTGRGFRGNGGSVENVDFFGYSWSLNEDANSNNIYTVTLNATGQSIYLNGQLRSIINQAYTASFNSVVLGTRLAGNLWNGQCYYFSIYNRELSATEIQQNFQAQRSRFGL
jgi:hypothetical protein